MEMPATVLVSLASRSFSPEGASKLAIRSRSRLTKYPITWAIGNLIPNKKA